MNPTLVEIKSLLKSEPKTWLVTGAAGFIGSHLVETLLSADQKVIGVDNLSNGRLSNFDEIRNKVGDSVWLNFDFAKIDVRDINQYRDRFAKVEYILHQAALGSVPRSIDNPVATHEVNVTGTLQMLEFARLNTVRKFVFASSSSVYGDSREMPQREDSVGTPQSPYAVSKRAAELYALNFAKTYDLDVVGLRYFNVFGPRQRPDGPYAAVIPKWTSAVFHGETPTIFGDGSTSRDFCFVENVVKANLLAALASRPASPGTIFNITMGGSTQLNQLYSMIARLTESYTGRVAPAPIFRDFRRGDLARSQADIQKATQELRYTPEVDVQEGLKRTIHWYFQTQLTNSNEALLT